MMDMLSDLGWNQVQINQSVITETVACISDLLDKMDQGYKEGRPLNFLSPNQQVRAFYNQK